MMDKHNSTHRIQAEVGIMWIRNEMNNDCEWRGSGKGEWRGKHMGQRDGSSVPLFPRSIEDIGR